MPAKAKQSSGVFRIFKNIGIFFLVLIIGVVLLKDLIIKTAIAQVGTPILGAKIDIKSFSWNMFTGKVVIKDLFVEHPPGFEEGNLVNIPEVIVQYDLGSILHGQYHMPLVVVNMKEMVVVKNKEGKLNVDALKVVHPDPNKKAPPLPPFKIDTLKLNVGQVVYKDYFKKDKPEILVYNVGIKDKTFKDIDNVAKLVTVVLVQAMKQTAIQGAGIYAAATVVGASFLPAAVVGVLVSKDDATGEIAKGMDKVLNVSETFIRQKGVFKKTDKNGDTATITGKIEGTDVTIKVEKISWQKTRLTIAARKYMLPKREFAAGILYQISQQLQ